MKPMVQKNSSMRCTMVGLMKKNGFVIWDFSEVHVRLKRTARVIWNKRFAMAIMWLTYRVYSSWASQVLALFLDERKRRRRDWRSMGTQPNSLQSNWKGKSQIITIITIITIIATNCNCSPENTRFCRNPKSAAVISRFEKVYARSMCFGNHVAVEHAHMRGYVVKIVVIHSVVDVTSWWSGTAIFFFCIVLAIIRCSIKDK